MPTEKLSATVDAEVLQRVRTIAGRRGLSAFVDRALRHEVERVQLRAFLDDLEAEIGPPDPALVSEAHRMLDDLEARSRGRRDRGSK